MQPIISNINNLSKELCRILTPITGCTGLTVKNWEDFVCQLQNVPIQDEEVMVSFDVQSLFTRVLIEGAIKAVESRLREYPEHRSSVSSLDVSHITSLTRFIIFNNKEQYEQTEGTPMRALLPTNCCYGVAHNCRQFLENEKLSQVGGWVESHFVLIKILMYSAVHMQTAHPR